MAINAQTPDNTSAYVVISGDAKSSDIPKIAQLSISRSSVPSDEVSSLRQQLVVLSSPLEIFEAQCSENASCPVPVGSSNQT